MTNKFCSLFFLFVLFNVECVAQLNEDKVVLYETSKDFLLDAKASLDATAIIKNEGDTYIEIKEIVDPNNKTIKRWRSYWSIERANNKYFNLGYSEDLNLWGTYLKFDITGRYCAIFIDSKLQKIVKRAGINYGGGLTGVMLSGQDKWGKNWVDTNGNKVKILFVDTSQSAIKIFSRNGSSLGNLLTKEKLIEIMGSTYKSIDINKISFEEVVEIIKEQNQVNNN